MVYQLNLVFEFNLPDFFIVYSVRRLSNGTDENFVPNFCDKTTREGVILKIKAYVLDLKWMCERKRMLWCKLNSDGSGWGEALCVFRCNSWFCYSRV